MSNQVLLVTVSDTDRFVIRLNQSSHISNFEKEAWCISQAHQAGIPVPTIVRTGLEGDYAYSIARFIPGSSAITRSHDRLRIWKKIGKYARLLNDIALTGNIGTESARHFHETWRDLVNEDLKLSLSLDHWVNAGIVSSTQFEKLQKLLTTVLEIQAPQGICQIDIGPDNALICFDDYEKIYLIDLELTVVAPVPHYQFACVARTWGFSSDIMKEFIAGYGISAEGMRQISIDLKNLIALRAMRVAGRAWQKKAADFDQAVAKAVPAIKEVLKNAG